MEFSLYFLSVLIEIQKYLKRKMVDMADMADIFEYSAIPLIQSILFCFYCFCYRFEALKRKDNIG